MNLQWDNKISLGHLISIGTILVAGSVAYGALRAEQDRVAAEVVSLEQSQQLHEGRIRAVELSLASQSSDLRNIQVTLGEIKVTLDRVADRP
jgi:hypothetical protein